MSLNSMVALSLSMKEARDPYQARIFTRFIRLQRFFLWNFSYLLLLDFFLHKFNSCTVLHLIKILKKKPGSLKFFETFANILTNLSNLSKVSNVSKPMMMMNKMAKRPSCTYTYFKCMINAWKHIYIYQAKLSPKFVRFCQILPDKSPFVYSNILIQKIYNPIFFSYHFSSDMLKDKEVIK